jgi:hypothetical protein
LSVLYAKLIPEKIEASLFAFLTGLSNLNNLFISNNLGILINLWIGVTEDPAVLAQKTWELYAVQCVCSLIPLLFIWLVPKRAQVAKVQRCFEYIDLYSGKDEKDQEFIYDDYLKLDPATAKRMAIVKPKGEEMDTATLLSSKEDA